jgi:predicted molibdopterin-dependent oxidoreductase YjgC
VTDPAAQRTPRTLTIQVDGRSMEVPAAASLAAALALNGVSALRLSEPSHLVRGVFCGMGSCHDCSVTVDGVIGVRSCLTPVTQGMDVETGTVTA